jgi:hypothetical protein
METPLLYRQLQDQLRQECAGVRQTGIASPVSGDLTGRPRL